MRIQRNFLQAIRIVMIMAIPYIGNYSKAVGAEISITLQMPSFSQQMDFLNEIVSERELRRQKQLEQDNIHQKLLDSGVPTSLKTGRDIFEEKLSPSDKNKDNSQPEDDPQLIEESKHKFKGVMEELENRYQELYTKSTTNLYSLPISNYYYSLLTPEVAESVPIHLIHAQNFNPSDDPFTTAIKLERLGLIIKDLTLQDAAPTILSNHFFERRRQLMGKCFALAGSHVNKAMKLLVEDPNTKINLEILKDMYQSGGLLYHWASLNVPFQTGVPMTLLTENFYTGLKMILHMYDSLEGATDEKKNNDY